MSAPRPPDPDRPLRLVQATCVLVGPGAVLIRGEPGRGKSSLAAALIARSDSRRAVRLVADDAVRLLACGDRLVALAPEPTRGRIEMRGVGIVATPFEPRAVVRLVVDLVDPLAVERLPDADAKVEIAGIELPHIALPGGDPASADRVLAALAVSGARTGVAAPDAEANDGAESGLVGTDRGIRT